MAADTLDHLLAAQVAGQRAEGMRTLEARRLARHRRGVGRTYAVASVRGQGQMPQRRASPDLGTDTRQAEQQRDRPSCHRPTSHPYLVRASALPRRSTRQRSQHCQGPAAVGSGQLALSRATNCMRTSPTAAPRIPIASDVDEFQLSLADCPRTTNAEAP